MSYPYHVMLEEASASAGPLCWVLSAPSRLSTAAWLSLLLWTKIFVRFVGGLGAGRWAACYASTSKQVLNRWCFPAQVPHEHTTVGE